MGTCAKSTGTHPPGSFEGSAMDSIYVEEGYQLVEESWQSKGFTDKDCCYNSLCWCCCSNRRQHHSGFVISTSTLIFLQEGSSLKKIIHSWLAGIWIDPIVGKLWRTSHSHQNSIAATTQSKWELQKPKQIVLEFFHTKHRSKMELCKKEFCNNICNTFIEEVCFAAFTSIWKRVRSASSTKTQFIQSTWIGRGECNTKASNP